MRIMDNIMAHHFMKIATEHVIEPPQSVALRRSQKERRL